ncbi:MAG: hypothetical protein WC527_00810 [Candidatus Margulisiibacteriota bacterium]
MADGGNTSAVASGSSPKTSNTASAPAYSAPVTTASNVLCLETKFAQPLPQTKELVKKSTDESGHINSETLYAGLSQEQKSRLGIKGIQSAQALQQLLIDKTQKASTKLTEDSFTAKLAAQDITPKGGLADIIPGGRIDIAPEGAAELNQIVHPIAKEEVSKAMTIPKRLSQEEVKKSGLDPDLERSLSKYVDKEQTGLPGTHSVETGKDGNLYIGKERITIGQDGKLVIPQDHRTQKLREKLADRLSSEFDNRVMEDRKKEIEAIKFTAPYKCLMLMHGGPGKYKEMARELKNLEAADKLLNNGKATPETEKFLQKSKEFLAARTGDNKDLGKARELTLDLYKEKIEKLVSLGQYDLAAQFDGDLRDSVAKSTERGHRKETDQWLKNNGYQYDRNTFETGLKTQAKLEEIMKLASSGKENLEKCRQMITESPEVGTQLENIFKAMKLTIGNNEQIADSSAFASLVDIYGTVSKERAVQAELMKNGAVTALETKAKGSLPMFFSGIAAAFRPGDGVGFFGGIKYAVKGATNTVTLPGQTLATGFDAVHRKAFPNPTRGQKILSTNIQNVLGTFAGPASVVTTPLNLIFNTKETVKTIKQGIAYDEYTPGLVVSTGLNVGAGSI